MGTSQLLMRPRSRETPYHAATVDGFIWIFYYKTANGLKQLVYKCEFKTSKINSPVLKHFFGTIKNVFEWNIVVFPCLLFEIVSNNINKNLWFYKWWLINKNKFVIGITTKIETRYRRR